MKKFIYPELDYKSLDEFIIQNYQTETFTDIGKLFDVPYQVIVGRYNSLVRESLIDKSLSLSSKQKELKSETKGQSKRGRKPNKDKVNIETLTETVVKRKYTKRDCNGENGVFKNDNGKGKQKVREFSSKLIGMTEETSPTILTLPSSHCKWEQEILKVKPNSKFYCVERDEKVFEQMKETIFTNETLRKSLIGLELCSIGDVISKSSENTFSHVILDYCGIITTFQNDIKETIQKNITKKDGIICVTLSKEGRFTHRSGNVLNTVYNSIDNYTDECDTVFCTKRIIEHIVISHNLSDTDSRYKVIDYMEYNDRSPMMCFFIKRIR